MLEHHRLVGCLQAFTMAAALLVPSVALAGSKDKPATQLANQAMQTDYLATQFKKAEKKLKKAISECGASACSYDVVGRLHRDLATVYIAGMKQGAKGKAELKLALQANPDLQLDNDLATPEVRKAFKALGGHEPKADEEEEPDEKPKPTKKEDEEDCEPGSDGCSKPASEAEPGAKNESPSKGSKNWFSVHFEQDFLVYSAQDNVCRSNVMGSVEAPGYSCFQSGRPFGHGAMDEIAAGAGNHIAAGVGRATSRILLGYDRLLGSNVSLGLRLGIALGGSPTTYEGAKFQPFHAEMRGNYWFGSDPFESSSVRPYVSLSAGLAEVDGHVLVEYYDNGGTKGTLDAWRRTGRAFAGLGLGMMIPFLGNSGIVPEVRAMEMLGTSAVAFDLALGYAYGF